MVSKEIVAHVAGLAKLSFSEGEMEVFQRQFQKIVAYVDRLNEVDTAGMDRLGRRAVGVSLLREDRAEGWDARDEGLENAPGREGAFFSVPLVVDKGDAHGAP